MSTQHRALFELRSYSARPGQRDALIDMFESIFLDAYQASGAQILGTFRSLDDPDRWVWIRAFEDAASRGQVLERFYGGEVWKRNAAACNALIADVAEAFLLRAAGPQSLTALCVPPPEAPLPDSVYELAIHPVTQRPAPPASFVTDRSENTYPRQRVRSDSVFVTLKRGTSSTAYAANVEVMHLAPTARSALR